MAWSPDNSTLAVATTTGLFFYQNQNDQWNELEKRGDQISFFSVVFTPDGKYVISGSHNGVIYVWDIAEGTLFKELYGHTDEVSTISITKDGQFLASGGRDHTLIIWDLNKWEALHTIAAGKGFVLSVSFSPDGKHLVSSLGYPDLFIQLWDVKTGIQLDTSAGRPKYDWTVEFSPIENIVVISCDQSGLYGVRIWNPVTGKLSKPDLDMNWHAVISPDGKNLITGIVNNQVQIWDIDSSSVIKVIPGFEEPIDLLKISPNGQFIAVASSGSLIKIYDQNSGKYTIAFEGFTNVIGAFSFLDDGSSLVTVEQNEGEILFWDVDSKSNLRSAKTYAHQYDLAVSKVNGTFMTNYFRAIGIWSIKSGDLIRLLEPYEDDLWSLDVSPDGTTIAVANTNGKVTIWYLNTNTEKTLFSNYNEWIWNEVAFSPDGKVLATGSMDGIVKLWNPEDGTLIQVLGPKMGGIRDLAFSDDGEYLAAGSKDRSIRIWSMTSFEEVQQFNHYYDEETKRFIGHYDIVTYLDFSPDGNLLATGSFDGTVRIWSVQTGTELLVLQGQTSYVFDVFFSQNGELLATSGRDGTVRIWKISNE